MFLGGTVYTVFYGAVLRGLSLHIACHMNGHLDL